MGRQIHFDLARDVLDKQLRDANEIPFGKVDGIVLRTQRGKPPRIDHLEVGGITAVHRLPKLLRRCIEPFARKWGAAGGKPMVIPWKNVMDVGIDIDVDIDASATQALFW